MKFFIGFSIFKIPDNIDVRNVKTNGFVLREQIDISDFALERCVFHNDKDFLSGEVRREMSNIIKQIKEQIVETLNVEIEKEIERQLA